MAKVNIDVKKILEAKREIKIHALWRIGQAVIAQAQKDKLVPIETGTLRRSAVVTLGRLPDPGEVCEKAKEGKGSKPLTIDSPEAHSENVDAAYVSYNTPYAEHLHENLNWTPRNWRAAPGGKIADSPPEGGPKWMEKAAAACRAKFPKILAGVIKERLK
jgi:hypothetical protein